MSDKLSPPIELVRPMKNLSVLPVILVVSLFVIPSSYAQQQRLTGGTAYGIVGRGDYLIPSGHLGYARQIAPHLDFTASLRFSRSREWEPLETYPDAPRDLSYLDGGVGLSLYPIDSDHHRLDLGIGAVLRGRWETRTKRIRVRMGPGGQPVELIDHKTERRTSADTGFLLRTGYSYRISRPFWLGVHLNGYTYQEGTTLFLFGLSVDYSL